MAKGSGEKTGIGGCCSFLSIFAFALTFLIIGCVYLYDCPLEPLIPIFLVVYGATMLFMVLAEGVYVMCDISATCPVIAVRFVLSLFSIAWMIAGCVFVFRTERPPGDATVDGRCDPVVYNSALALVIIALIGWGLTLLAKLCVCLCGSK